MLDKKYMIGVNLLAVVLLVLGSLSNVVGYQSMKSTVNDSPLFQTRTQRATNQQQSSITSQYLGMEKENLLQFPVQDNRTEQLKKVAEYIRKMDEKTFVQFTELCIKRARQDNTLSDINSNDIIRAFKLLRTKPEMIINSFTIRNYRGFTEYQTFCNYYPGCIFDYFLVIIFFLSLIILIPLYLLVTLYFFTYFCCGNP